MGHGRTNAGGGIGTVTATNLSAGNIKKGVTIKIGDETDDEKYYRVTGTFIGVNKYTASSYNASTGVATFVVSGMTSSTTLKKWTIALSNELHGFGNGTTGHYYIADNAEYSLSVTKGTDLITITFSKWGSTTFFPASGSTFTLYIFEE